MQSLEYRAFPGWSLGTSHLGGLYLDSETSGILKLVGVLSAAEETEKELSDRVRAIHYPIGHFDIYVGDNFAKSVKAQLEFFKEKLLKEEKVGSRELEYRRI